MKLIDITEIWDPYKNEEISEELKIPNSIIDKINGLMDLPSNFITKVTNRTLLVNGNPGFRILIYNQMSNMARIERVSDMVVISVNEKIFNLMQKSNLVFKIPYNLFQYASKSDKETLEKYL